MALMTAAVEISKNFVSFEDYVAGEELAEHRHEYINGQVVKMAGASDDHELVAMNLSTSIHSHLRGKGCRVYKGDMKLRFQASQVDLGYYPDVMVVCDPEDNHAKYKERPKLIVEVMSRFKTDHFEKLFIYQQIAILEEYLIVDQNPNEQRAWLYQRDQHWAMPEPLTEGEIHLESIDLTLELGSLYLS